MNSMIYINSHNEYNNLISKLWMTKNEKIYEKYTKKII